MLVIFFRASNGVRKCLNGNPSYKNVSKCLPQTVLGNHVNHYSMNLEQLAPYCCMSSNVLLQFWLMFYVSVYFVCLCASAKNMWWRHYAFWTSMWPSVHPLTLISRDTISLYLVEGFQWNFGWVIWPVKTRPWYDL